MKFMSVVLGSIIALAVSVECTQVDAGGGHSTLSLSPEEEAALGEMALTSRQIDILSKKLRHIAALGRTDEVNELIRRGAHVNSVGFFRQQTALMRAAKNGHTQTVNSLLVQGAEVNRFDCEGLTELMHAVRGGHTEVVGLLLAYGASPDLEEQFPRYRTMVEAARGGHTEIVELLLAHHAKRNLEEALRVAARRGNENMMRLLLDNGADPKVRDEYGKNAFHYALKSKTGQVIKDFKLGEKQDRFHNTKSARNTVQGNDIE